MNKQPALARREFLKLSGIAVSAAALKACTPTLPVAAPAPTDVPKQNPVEALFPDMVLVEAGSFLMGSMDGYPDQQPVHRRPDGILAGGQVDLRNAVRSAKIDLAPP